MVRYAVKKIKTLHSEGISLHFLVTAALPFNFKFIDLFFFFVTSIFIQCSWEMPGHWAQAQESQGANAGPRAWPLPGALGKWREDAPPELDSARPADWPISHLPGETSLRL